MPAAEVPAPAPTKEPEPEPPNCRPLRRLGSYELVRQIARGGMADIYLARRDGIGSFERHIALKVLNKHRAKDAEACQMFLDEARVVALLNHHNIAAVLDVDVVEDQHYLAMEYVHGVDLREMLAMSVRKRVPVPYETALSIVAGAAAGLDHAHRRVGPDGQPLCLVHRDISLSNVMVGHDGSVKVIDFGIAQTAIATVHTSPGTVRGKASYMSPEQCLGEAIDHRTDVFALGIVLYELTTGARCFSGKNDFERMLAVVRGEFVPPSQLVQDYPPELEQVVLRALATDPVKRYATASEFMETLEDVAATRQWITGANSIVSLLRQLFGEVAEPWAATPVDVVVPESPPTMRGHRLARGTEPPPELARGSEPDLHRSCGWTPSPDEDDEPTRGRRSIRRPPTAPPNAAA
ncbi:MAG TPA: serine/threonine-protein kinase [Kofleriaceae bacterium]